jgi:hypothetical protein
VGSEGQLISIIGTFSDPGIFDAHTAVIDWGDGSQSAGQVVEAGGEGTITASHVYADNGAYPIRVEVLDNNQGLDTGEAIADIGNLAPSASVIGPNTAIPGQSLVFTLGATDSSLIDEAAGFAFFIDWDDGSSVETINPLPGNGVGISVHHAFPALGTYRPEIQAIDKDGGASSVTGLVGVVTVSASFYVLAPSGSGTLKLSGNGDLTTDGVVIVDSDSTSALSASGNGSLTASAIQVVGGYRATGNASFYPTPVTGATFAPDPLAGLAAPTSGVSRGSVNLSSNNSLTINPGIYTQIKVSGNARLTLNPGVYILKGGGLSVSGNGRLSGAGVIFYNAGSSFPSPGGTLGSISISGNGAIALSPPTTGPYTGILVFQARENTKTLTLSGNAAAGMRGTIYAKAAQLSLSGNGVLRQALVVDRLTLSGNGSALRAGSTTAVAEPDLEPGGLLTRDLRIRIDNTNGLLTTGRRERIEDAVASLNNALAPHSVTVTLVDQASVDAHANITLDVQGNTAIGGVAESVLGYTSGSDGITFVSGWDWYVGDDASDIGVAQYDFQTVVTHEIGHALGLGHSADPTSFMYASLHPGATRRVVTTTDFEPNHNYLANAAREATAASALMAAGAEEITNHNNVSSPGAPSVIASYSQIPMSFEPNLGQTNDQVEFLSRGNGYGLFLTRTEAVLSLQPPEESFDHADAQGDVSEHVIRMQLVDADPNPRIVGQDLLPGHVNYFSGSDPDQWRTNVPTFGKVHYDGVYPGVDLVYYGNQRENWSTILWSRRMPIRMRSSCGLAGPIAFPSTARAISSWTWEMSK